MNEQNECHISSLIVYLEPEQQNQICHRLGAVEGCEVHAAEQGKVIITLEADSQKQLAGLMDSITLIKGVIQSVPVYHEYFSLSEQTEIVNQSPVLPA
ncbi:chaperone NapD [Catenovulum sp. 2E275]|uniref:chaperone NapD n=1 Tax=Catenovulum sp. 2E275 TaxID=2980497 RepID=UPI0021CE0AD1|nr:chaperone NapD [Catenovulum sp. 2E275]MCU4676703.1 chaperone NapD [Catenovulum sp. 2E275]